MHCKCIAPCSTPGLQAAGPSGFKVFFCRILQVGYLIHEVDSIWFIFPPSSPPMDIPLEGLFFPFVRKIFDTGDLYR